MLSACRGALRIDRSRDFNAKQNELAKIICLDPDFELLTTTGKRKTKHHHKRITAKEIQLNNILFRNAKKNHITLQIIDTKRMTTNDDTYFHHLAPLKREILQTSFLQKFTNKKGRTPTKQVFNTHENAPAIDSKYSYLAAQYATPYFAVQGITIHRKPKNGFFSPQVDTYYYTIIADVIQAEIVYREVRRVDAPVSDANLNALIYDSFKIISK